jgi:hypothetical protein
MDLLGESGADEVVDLEAEFVDLFPILATPPSYDPALERDTIPPLGKAVADALLNLRVLGWWIQGLVDELTLDKRLRMEAEEKAKLAAKPPTGFASPA